MKIKVLGNDSKNSSREVDIYSKEGFDLLAKLWSKCAYHHRIMYEPTWLGIPIIQYPEDITIIQELIWKVRPDVIIETGVAHGGSAILQASILELIGKGKVIGIDLEIRKYNELAIRSHPLSKRIHLIEGSSIANETYLKVKKQLKNSDKVLIFLDSNHSYEHVKREIELYSSLVSPDSYLVVLDGIQKELWDTPGGKKEWQEDNPLTAIEEFMQDNTEWEIDEYYMRFAVTANPNGFLKRLNNEQG